MHSEPVEPQTYARRVNALCRFVQTLCAGKIHRLADQKRTFRLPELALQVVVTS